MVKTWSENESFLMQPLLDTGYFEDTGKKIRVSGMESVKLQFGKLKISKGLQMAKIEVSFIESDRKIVMEEINSLGACCLG